MNPISQTFFIPQETYPAGIFAASVDLCFSSKPTVTALPVSVQIRPTVNGFPSASEILPFSMVSRRPEEVRITTAPDFSTEYTRFEFPSPVYLAPGEYAITVFTNDPDYDVYTAVLGDTMVGSSRIVSKQPYAGTFFKSSNGTTFTPIQNEDLMFRLNKCAFTTATTGTLGFTANTPSSNVNLDANFLYAGQATFSPTTLNWSEKATPNSTLTLASSYTDIEANKTNYYFDSTGRRIILASPSGNNGKYFAQAELITTSEDVSPVINLERVSLLGIENRINNDNNNETGAFGGNAIARYITRRVTLAEGFDASALRVYLSAYKPSTASILVYYKILSRNDPDSFDNKLWQALTQITSTNVNSSKQTDFFEFQFSPSVYSDTVSYTSNSIRYDTFANFAIKVVMLSSDTTNPPRIKEFRAIALPIA